MANCILILSKHVEFISLKVLVDKEKKRVIFAECGHDLVDILFSFLTTPMGTIIKLALTNSLTMGIGSMNNLYKSVKNMDVQHFRAEAYKAMLLIPRNGAESHCKNLKLRIDNADSKIFYCSLDCLASKFKLLSYYGNVLCECGNPMRSGAKLSENTASKSSSSAVEDGGVFVKALNRYMISDDLQVMPLCAAATVALLSKSGVSDWSTIEERSFNLGVTEVLNLLSCSLVSKTPLTETLLKHKLEVPELNNAFCHQGRPVESRIRQEMENEGQNIHVKLIVSKSRKIVFFAEAKKDFINLLFSFLTVPLGHMVKKTDGGSSRGCIDNLYKSVQDLDEQCFKSNNQKELLVSPRVAPGFSYENDLLGIGEASHPPYYFDINRRKLTDTNVFSGSTEPTPIKVINSNSSDKEGKSRGGFLGGPTLFTVTDDLIITPVSPILGLSILNELKVPFSDIEERTVHVGKEEALHLLVSSFVSESVLTNAFIIEQKQREC